MERKEEGPRMAKSDDDTEEIEDSEAPQDVLVPDLEHPVDQAPEQPPVVINNGPCEKGDREELREEAQVQVYGVSHCLPAGKQIARCGAGRTDGYASAHHGGGYGH